VLSVEGKVGIKIPADKIHGDERKQTDR